MVDAGLRIDFDDHAVVDHHQELPPLAFWRQQVRYGRGAVAVHRNGVDERRPLAFYLSLVRAGFRTGPGVGVAVVIGQLATTVGFTMEAVRRQFGET
ncbi:MAG: hypothetical protein AAGG08_10725 [Actinomycetota bacterium]